MNVLKVSSKSNANSVAGALAAAIRDFSEAELQAVGGDCHCVGLPRAERGSALCTAVL